jgi:hypothetical protein
MKCHHRCFCHSLQLHGERERGPVAIPTLNLDSTVRAFKSEVSIAAFAPRVLMSRRGRRFFFSKLDSPGFHSNFQWRLLEFTNRFNEIFHVPFRLFREGRCKSLFPWTVISLPMSYFLLGSRDTFNSSRVNGRHILSRGNPKGQDFSGFVLL